jgi:hypothetical protein
MILINNKLVSETHCGQITIEENIYVRLGDNKYVEYFFGTEVSRSDLERIYVFEVIKADRDAKNYKDFQKKVDRLLIDLNIDKE